MLDKASICVNAIVLTYQLCVGNRDRLRRLPKVLRRERVSIWCHPSARQRQRQPLVPPINYNADPILNRNFFSPPNQSPKFTTPSRLTATLGQSPALAVQAEDPEKDNVRYAIVGEAPEGLELDPQTGAIKWNPTTVGSYPLAVEAIDSGYPARRIEQRFEIAVVNPPPPPPPATGRSRTRISIRRSRISLRA